MEISGYNFRDGKFISIRIAGGSIREISFTPEPKTSGPKKYLAPGLIDHQVNGYLGHSFSEPGLTLQQVRTIVHVLRKQGITSFLPTITTSSSEQTIRSITILRKAMLDPELGKSIVGIHLEGPYISPEDGFRGVHPEEWIRNPDWEEFSRFQDASGGNILEVTLAPELPDALDFIRKCSQSGVKVALGHHNASTEVIKAAADSGATLVTHLGNGCSNLVHRHHNPLWPQLAEDRLAASLIADGFHLTPEQVKVFYRSKGIRKLMLVSDYSHLAGLPAGKYQAWGRAVEMTPEGKITMPSENVLAAASLPVTRGIANFMKFTGSGLAEAVSLATENPAHFLNLNNRGELSPGKRADLILFSYENSTIHIHKTWVSGEIAE